MIHPSFIKQLLIYSMLLVINVTTSAQTSNTISSDNIVSEVYKGIFIEMPDLREINSGSKFIVNYEGDWPAEMQGAFEYAVKLWEEVLPMTLPIKITASIGNIRSSKNVISRTKTELMTFEGVNVNQYACPVSMVKGVLLKENHNREQYRFFDEISNVSDFEDTDISIIYNTNMMNECDFSLDPNLYINKYDFVTVALRDIAIGLGFTTAFTANTNTKTFDFPDQKLMPFEALVIESLNTKDPKLAYINATKGSLEINLRSSGNNYIPQLNMYAPTEWINGTSLRYLIPEDNPISKLLTYDFGKGYVMRDLSGIDWADVFSGALDWTAYTASGKSSGSVSNIGTSEDIFPYKGQVTLSFNDNDKKAFVKKESESVKKNLSNSTILNETSSNEMEESIADYCRKFNSYSPNGPSQYDGLSLSVLKKDGTWDCIYETPYIPYPTTINIEYLKLNYQDSEYARGTTGGLRYRLCQCTPHEDTLHGGTYYEYEVKYFTRDFTPQKANIKYTKSLSNTYDIQTAEISDDYFIDVKVGISNVEGTTKVIVEQLDEGESLPFQYEVEDFRKGYFIANLDRECSTQLTVISYNDNGYKRSNTITIPAIGFNEETIFEETISFSIYNNSIYIHGLDLSQIQNENYTYTIQKLDSMITMAPVKLRHTSIDISRSSSGIYVFTLFKNSQPIGTFKYQI